MKTNTPDRKLKGYTIDLPNSEYRSFSALTNATQFADAFVQENGGDLEVVHDGTGVIVYTAALKVEGQFNPWERVQRNPGFSSPHFDGYRLAYVRKRIQASVYRPLNTGDAWLVHDGRTGNTATATNTKAACTLTKQMRLGRHL